MSLLDTYFKLQALKQQQQNAQAQELHSILYLADAVQKMNAIQREEGANQALSRISPDIVKEHPAGLVGLPEGYDTPDPEMVLRTTIPKPEEQIYRESYEATKPFGVKYSLPYLNATMAVRKERETERRKREENPLVPFEFGGVTGTAALSNVAPLEEKRLSRQSRDEYLTDKLEETTRHNKAIEGIRKAVSEKGGEKNKLTMSDVKGAYSMEMAGIKNRIALDLINSPAEAQALSGQPAENLMAMLLSGNIKSIPAEKKQAYMDEIRQVEDYYGSLSAGVLGKKGATPKTPKTATPAQPQGKVIATLPPGSKMIGTKDGKEVWQDPKTGIKYLKE